MLGYYPGCTVRANKFDNFEGQSLAILETLGIPAVELSEWECCGAVYPLTNDEYAPLLSSVRALIRTGEEKRDGLLTLCSACYHVLKRVNNRMNNDQEAKRRVENYLGKSYDGNTQVYHLIEVLRDHVGLDNLQQRVVAPLKGERIAAYYGCLFLRPQKELGLLDAENPQLMEEIIQTLGAEAVLYPYRTDCCGAFHSSQKQDICNSASMKILRAAKESGATELVTACPLCKHNFDFSQKGLREEERLTVSYITGPIMRALGAGKKLEDLRVS